MKIKRVGNTTNTKIHWQKIKVKSKRNCTVIGDNISIPDFHACLINC